MRSLVSSLKTVIVAVLGCSWAAFGYGQFLPTKLFCEEVEALLCQKAGGSCPIDVKTQHKHQCMEFVHPIVEQKAVRYQSPQARLCLSQLKSGGARFPSVCGLVLEGLIKNGDSCEWSLSCAGPNVCIKSSGALKGKCSRGLGAQAPCELEPTSGSLFATELLRQKSPCALGLKCLEDSKGARSCR